MDQNTFTVTLSRDLAYRFAADFGLPGVPPLTLDEAPPLGNTEGPDPARVLAAAVGACLATSLQFCLQKARIEVQDLDTQIDMMIDRNERGRLRITGIAVRLAPTVAPEARYRVNQSSELFEDFRIVTESVRRGIPITVDVAPRVEEPALATTA
jgi:uncharacterized OsmC-like protein